MGSEGTDSSRPGDVEAKPGKSRLPAGCLAVLAVASLLAGLAVAGTRAGLSWYIRSQRDAATIRKMDDVLTRRIAVRPEWQTPIPPNPPRFADALYELAMEVDRQFSATGPASYSDKMLTLRRALQHAQSLSEPEWKSISNLAIAAEPVQKRLHDTVSVADFTLNQSLRQAPLLEYLVFPRIHWLHHNGDTTAAVALLRDLLALGRHELPFYNVWLPQVQTEALHVQCMLADATSSTASLRETLQYLDTNGAYFAYMPELDPWEANDIDALRCLAGYGCSVNLNASRPLISHTDEAIEQSWQLITRKLTAADTPAGERRDFEYMKSQMNEMFEQLSENHAKNRFQFRLVRMLAPDLVAANLLSESDAHAVIQREAMACYDLTRLRIAQRILKLEGRTEETTASAFVPEFLPKPVRDPFDGNTYRWDAASRQFYSVGPDVDDDLLKTEYHYSEDSPPGNGDLAIPGEMPPARK